MGSIPGWARFVMLAEIAILGLAFALPWALKPPPPPPLGGEVTEGGGPPTTVVWSSPPIRALGDGETAAMEAALRFDINRAYAEDLERIPGVGEKTAQAIVAYREANGNYRRLSDLRSVPGVGEAAYKSMLPYIRLGDELGEGVGLSAAYEKGKVIVNVNAASLEELQLLPVVGPAMAEEILAHRPFSNPQDLDDRVKGLGPAKLEKMLPFLAFQGPNVTPVAAAADVEAGRLIELNTATAEELDQLPDIGESMAQAIVAYRTEHGPFQSINDLRNIKRFGETKIEKIRSLITINGVRPPE